MVTGIDWHSVVHHLAKCSVLFIMLDRGKYGIAEYSVAADVLSQKPLLKCLFTTDLNLGLVDSVSLSLYCHFQILISLHKVCGEVR